jgi:hypothetical protein
MDYTLELPEPFRQRDAEAYYLALSALDGADDVIRIVHTGNIVRAAARVGWVPGLAEENVGDLPPAAVADLAAGIQNRLAKAFQLSGN